MNRSDDHGVGHFRVSIEKPLGFVQSKIDVSSKNKFVVVNV